MRSLLKPQRKRHIPKFPNITEHLLNGCNDFKSCFRLNSYEIRQDWYYCPSPPLLSGPNPMPMSTATVSPPSADRDKAEDGEEYCEVLSHFQRGNVVASERRKSHGFLGTLPAEPSENYLPSTPFVNCSIDERPFMSMQNCYSRGLAVSTDQTSSASLDCVVNGDT